VMKKYEFINHTADLGIRVWGESIKELFKNAAYSMFDTIADLNRVKLKKTMKVEIEKEELDELLADWLRNLLYKFNGDRYLLKEFKVETIDTQGLKAKVKGEKLDLSRHHLKREIKAVTYHGLEVKKADRGWEAQIIFDV
jgi:SHS2 domain-containing protein